LAVHDRIQSSFVSLNFIDLFRLARVARAAAKEQEMKIGCPTDVKHVAHIGWNTSTGTLTGNAPPSWVNTDPDQFSAKPEFCCIISPFLSSQMSGLGESSDLSSLGNFALAPSAGTSWASQGTVTQIYTNASQFGAVVSCDCALFR
jgi:hypothetical protein